MAVEVSFYHGGKTYKIKMNYTMPRMADKVGKALKKGAGVTLRPSGSPKTMIVPSEALRNSVIVLQEINDD